jgi:hypothetical protein
MKVSLTGAVLLVTIAMLALSGSASASVSFDPTTGTGFVGKADVKKAFGWSNTELQDNASQVFFEYDEQWVYSVTCGGVTGTHNTAVSSTLRSRPRLHRQVSGFEITDFGSTHTDNTTPVVGEPCTLDGQTGVWTDVTFTGTTAAELFTTFEGERVSLGSP